MPPSLGYEDTALGETCLADLTEGVHGHLAFFRAHSVLAELMVQVRHC